MCFSKSDFQIKVHFQNPWKSHAQNPCRPWGLPSHPQISWHPQILADPLTLSQPRGADYSHQIILAPPDLQTFLRPCPMIHTSRGVSHTLLHSWISTLQQNLISHKKDEGAHWLNRIYFCRGYQHISPIYSGIRNSNQSRISWKVASISIKSILQCISSS